MRREGHLHRYPLIMNSAAIWMGLTGKSNGEAFPRLQFRVRGK